MGSYSRKLLNWKFDMDYLVAGERGYCRQVLKQKGTLLKVFRGEPLVLVLVLVTQTMANVTRQAQQVG